MIKLQIGVVLYIWMMVCIVHGSVIRMQQEFLGVKKASPNSFLDFGTDPRPQLNVTQTAGNETFAFAAYYGDHMVLQRAPQRALLWGYAHPEWTGQQVTVTLQTESGDHSSTVTATVRQQGPANLSVWNVLLEAHPAGGPYTVKANIRTHTLALEDVFFGDVWLCSGQSNMQFTVPQMFDSAAEMAIADTLPLVRLFTVAENSAPVPLYDLAKVEQVWSVANSTNVNHGAFGYFSAVCWTYGRYLQQFLGVPVGMLSTTWGGTPVEAWSSTAALKRCGIKEKSVGGPAAHSVLYNAMIHPLLNLTIKGAIWYQGEANADAPDKYNCTFPTMIDDWRKKWGAGTQKQTQDNFPFGFVQLGPSAVYAKGKDVTRGYPDIRWHQTADQGHVPNPRMLNTFMASAVDLTDDASPYGSVHIRDKQTVGQRLVLSSLSLVYGAQGLKYQGPTVTGFFIDSGSHTLRLEFDSGKDPITVQSESRGFEVCCSSDNQTPCGEDSAPGPGPTPHWLPTPIVAHDGSSVTVTWAPCAASWVVGMRYLWRETPCTYKACPVYSVENNLPATPFIVQFMWEQLGEIDQQLGGELKLEQVGN